MPMIDFFAPSGVLRADELTALAGRIIAAVQEEEGYTGNRKADAISWIYVHEVPAGRMLTGRGARHGELWRIEVSTPTGALADSAKVRLGRALERLVSQAEGAPPNGRVWCLFRDVRDGDWVVGPHVASVAAVRQMVGAEAVPA